MDYNAVFEAEGELNTRRSENAKAFDDYVQAKVNNGEDIDPLELHRVKLAMAQGDHVTAAMIPSKEALKQMADTANQRSRLTKMGLYNKTLELGQLESDTVQKVIDNNWDKTPEDMAKVFTSIFGDKDGQDIYGKYKPELNAMLNRSTQKKTSEIMSNPALAGITDESQLYSIFPSEMRNPAVAKLYTEVVKRNKQTRTAADAKMEADYTKSLPKGAAETPEAKQAILDMTARLKGYENAASAPLSSQTEANLNSETQLFERQAKAQIIAAAGKDQAFLNSQKTGYQDTMFQAVSNLMEQAGLKAPINSDDPSYKDILKTLGVVNLSANMDEYSTRKAELIKYGTKEAQQLKDNAKGIIKTTLDQYFYQEPYSDGGKTNPAIVAAMNAISMDSNFFPSKGNVTRAAEFIKNQFDKSKNFDPSVVAGQATASGIFESEGDYITHTVTKALEQQYQIEPGTNINLYTDKFSTNIYSKLDKLSEMLKIQPVSRDDYTNILNLRSSYVSNLKAEIANKKALIDAINDDVAKRKSVTEFNYPFEVQKLMVLEQSLKALEEITVPIPSGYRYNSQYSGGIEINPAGNAPQNVTPGSFQDMTRAPKGFMYLKDGSLVEENPSYIWSGEAQDGNAKYYPPRGMKQSNNDVYKFQSYMDKLAMAESSKDPFARAKTSSAKGMYQFTDGTWRSMIDKYGKSYNLTYADIDNPQAQDVMATLLSIDNFKELFSRTGKAPSHEELYMAHFLGPGRASVIINNRDSGRLAAQLFPDAAQANRDIFYKDGVPVTVAELYKELGKRFNKKG